MKELSQITHGFASLCASNKPAALATVIAVEGSSYRRPGAKMLIAEDGRTWGGVSGGCLERDVARRGRGVIETGRSVRCRYDTTDDEELAGGVATGCGGSVELFIQRVSTDSPGPLLAMQQVIETRQPILIATRLVTDGPSHDLTKVIDGYLHLPSFPSPGTPGEGKGGGLEPSRDETSSAPSPARPRHTGGGRKQPHSIDADRELAGLPGGSLIPSHGTPGEGQGGGCWPAIINSQGCELFIERIVAPQGLVIFGAGPDAAPLAEMAKLLGWHVTVVGTRPATDMPSRFPTADLLHVTSSDNPLENVSIAPDSAVVLMTHNFARDIAILNKLPLGLPYLGVLGPRRRTDEVLAELSIDRTAERIFAPIGLDLAAETPEQIALSILAEIQAVTHGGACKPLRDRPGPIHRDTSPSPADDGKGQWSSACPI